MLGINGFVGGFSDILFIEGISEVKEYIFFFMNESSLSINIERNLREILFLVMDVDIDVYGIIEDDDELFDLDFYYKLEFCKVKF